MTAKQYVNSVKRKLKCSPERKEDISKELLSKIETRLRKGEQLDAILTQMGTAKEKANQYNAKIPPKERKTYDRKIRIITMVSLLFFLFGVSFLISNRPMMEELYIGDSKYFSKAEVESYTKNIIDYLDENNCTALKEHSRPEMHAIFTEDKLNEAKEKVAENWGKRLELGEMKVTEIMKDRKEHYATIDLTASYENVEITYRFAYDTNMKLAAIYMK